MFTSTCKTLKNKKIILCGVLLALPLLSAMALVNDSRPDKFEHMGSMSLTKNTKLPVTFDTSLLQPADIPIQNIAEIAVGSAHTCALTSQGGVTCWGWKSGRQTGNASIDDSSFPVYVSGLTSGVIALAAGGEYDSGSDYTCALTSQGGVKCWGDPGAYGSLGDGTDNSSFTPVDVSGLKSGVIALALGGKHICALTKQGGVKCWGWKAYGQLGDGIVDAYTNGIYDYSTIPVDVSTLTSGVISIAAGKNHTCALTTQGGVKCWGENFSWQLGIYDNSRYTYGKIPVDVPSLTSSVAAIAAGNDHTCALTAQGGVKCWGGNKFGQLGDGTTTDSATPVDVSGMTSGVVALVAGGNHTCTLTAQGGVKCWGENDIGQLGDGTITDRYTPMDVSGLTSGIASLSTGNEHTCALTTQGGVKCWGWNYFGQLGNGVLHYSITPVEVSGLTSGVVSLKAGGAYNSGSDYTCALIAQGGVKCWGYNANGQLGDGTTINRHMPVDVSGLTSGATALTTGGDHTCALTAQGGVKCWGWNNDGQLGDGTTTHRYTPVDVSGLSSGATAIAAGGDHTCALTTQGGVKCWGDNRFGQLGDGTTNDSDTAVDVSSLMSGVAALAAGGDHSCALTTQGGVKCWGWNNDGQLGDGTTTDRYTPVDVSGLSSGATAIAAGGDHTCALTTQGSVMCWGWDYASSVPVYVYGYQHGLTSGILALAVGEYHTCALTTQGGVKCWGKNGYGQLGNGTTTGSDTPVDVFLGLTSGMTALAVGEYHTCALTAQGGVKCWGWNRYGQLGNGILDYCTIPVEVVSGEEPPVIVSTQNVAQGISVTSHPFCALLPITLVIIIIIAGLVLWKRHTGGGIRS
jgi:alpha-tubulin suppressor-like RCC1 family protein